MRIGIPSYQRVNSCKTLDTLISMGYGRDEIIISTQTADEYRAYQQAHGDKATIIYREGSNDSVNRNTILAFMNVDEEFILMDDDIKAFNRLEMVSGKG